MSADWPAPDYWCTICDRGAEGCLHTPADVKYLPFKCGHCGEQVHAGGACGCKPIRNSSTGSETNG